MRYFFLDLKQGQNRFLPKNYGRFQNEREKMINFVRIFTIMFSITFFQIKGLSLTQTFLIIVFFRQIIQSPNLWNGMRKRVGHRPVNEIYKLLDHSYWISWHGDHGSHSDQKEAMSSSEVDMSSLNTPIKLPHIIKMYISSLIFIFIIRS